MDRGINIVVTDEFRRRDEHFLFDPRKVYEFLSGDDKVLTYVLRIYNIYGRIEKYIGLIIRYDLYEKYVVKMIETKFPFRGKIGIDEFHVVFIRGKIHFVKDSDYFDSIDHSRTCRLSPKTLILVFSHGYICVAHIRIWKDDEYENIFMVDEPIPCISEHIKSNLAEIMKIWYGIENVL